QVVEMETSAIATVAYANTVPYIGFRSLSDLAGGDCRGFHFHDLRIESIEQVLAKISVVLKNRAGHTIAAQNHFRWAG
ncbi:MAG: hypothetical protein AAGJ68_02120, partial [Pseudomonadota bacterium]